MMTHRMNTSKILLCGFLKKCFAMQNFSIVLEPLSRRFRVKGTQRVFAFLINLAPLVKTRVQNVAESSSSTNWWVDFVQVPVKRHLFPSLKGDPDQRNHAGVPKLLRPTYA